MHLLLLLLPISVLNHVEATSVSAPRVGAIIIEGNTYIDGRVIINELKQAGVKVGSTFTQAQLAKAAANLNRRGIFDPDEPPTVFVMQGEGTNFEKHIFVRVKETRTGTFRSGVGVGEYRPSKPQPIEDAYRKLVSYQSLFVAGSDIINCPRTGVWYDPR